MAEVFASAVSVRSPLLYPTLVRPAWWILTLRHQRQCGNKIWYLRPLSALHFGICKYCQRVTGQALIRRSAGHLLAADSYQCAESKSAQLRAGRLEIHKSRAQRCQKLSLIHR